MDLVAFRVPKENVEEIYSLQWKENEPYDGESILVKYARLKGYFGGAGLPNQACAARYVLKDYVNGVLVYNHPPPASHNKELTFIERQTQLER
jgi:large subunit GTPase 1